MNRRLEDKTILKVNMLGGFSLVYGNKPVPNNYSGTSKMMQLFQILLYAGREGISRGELIDRLYGREDLEDAGATLRVNIYRLRKYIQKLKCFENDDCIWFQEGVYRWNYTAVPLERDTDHFNTTAEAALKEENPEIKMELLKEACRMYRGEFLPELAGEEWVAIESCKYQKLYVDCINEAAVLLKENGQFAELLELSSQASSIYYFEEYYLMQIDCLMALGRYKEAMEIYETAAAFYFEELGLEPSEEMLDRFRQMRDKIHYNASVISDIKHGLQEGENNNGAYFCSYPGFVDCYHIVCRMSERSGQPAFLMLCTLVDSEDVPLTEEARLGNYMDKLKSAIRSALRRGDSFTRYGNNQFLVLLVGIKQENCAITQSRITNCFLSYGLRGKISVRYEIYPATEEEGPAGNLLFHQNNDWQNA